MANQVTGLILAGGEGRRMGGADKGLLPYRGRPLAAHVIERLMPQVDALLISANRNIETYRTFGYPVLPDATNEHQGPHGHQQGPLAGLYAGLAACQTAWLITCPCDCPTLPDDLVIRLFTAAETQKRRLAVATTAEGVQPTFQLCHRALLPNLNAYLASGERKLSQWCHEQNAIEVAFPDPNAFMNLNSPEDYGNLSCA